MKTYEDNERYEEERQNHRCNQCGVISNRFANTKHMGKHLCFECYTQKQEFELKEMLYELFEFSDVFNMGDLLKCSHLVILNEMGLELNEQDVDDIIRHIGTGARNAIIRKFNNECYYME